MAAVADNTTIPWDWYVDPSVARLEHKPEIETALHATFERLLARYRETRPSGAGRRR